MQVSMLSLVVPSLKRVPAYSIHHELLAEFPSRLYKVWIVGLVALLCAHSLNTPVLSSGATPKPMHSDARDRTSRRIPIVIIYL